MHSILHIAQLLLHWQTETEVIKPLIACLRRLLINLMEADGADKESCELNGKCLRSIAAVQQVWSGQSHQAEVHQGDDQCHPLWRARHRRDCINTHL